MELSSVILTTTNYVRIYEYNCTLCIISKHNKSANGNATFLIDDRYLLPYPVQNLSFLLEAAHHPPDRRTTNYELRKFLVAIQCAVHWSNQKLKCRFCKKLLLYECNSDQLPTFFSSKLDFPVIKRLERDFFTLSEFTSNVFITRESNFYERSGQLIRVAFVKR